MALTQDTVDSILQHARGPGFCFLDTEALDAWLEDHDVEASCGGRTLLVWALHRRRYTAVKALLARGADPNARDGSDGSIGWMPLQFAVDTLHYDTVKLLVRHGARVDEFDLGGMGLSRQTALQVVAWIWYRHKKRAEYDEDYEGEIEEYHFREVDCMVRLLLSLGATIDKHVPMDFSNTPPSGIPLIYSASAEDMAHRYGNRDTRDLLRTIRLAGGWKSYAAAPRKKLLVLRALCCKQRAAAPAGTVLERLFPFSGSAALPNELFCRIFQFWRCEGVDVPVTVFKSKNSSAADEVKRRRIERREGPEYDPDSEYYDEWEEDLDLGRPDSEFCESQAQDDLDMLRPFWWYEIDNFVADDHIG